MGHPYRWQPLDGIGLEHLNLDYRDDVIVADGVVVGDCGDGPFGCSYRICCDTAWRVRSVEVHAAGGASLVLTSDGSGHWRDGDGAVQPQLGGCTDVDIAATPFTNTLPVRRLGAVLQARTRIAVVYIPVPALAARRMEQAYTRLADGRYLYEWPIGDFQAELELDADGLVRHYPSLFTRLLPA
ncbi:putative glycolipid-binding domain-containing protein [Massilia alkalitolerans]|uniref:putative glycolipid-binding domain-containing protein n=1 Tax=Massilia alkalitolerans TaxID=286638 RepID=UPI0003F9A6A7|nr:putative glycolipid-binding domain-containing protein [Massilia alkalitolerans]